MVPIAHDPNVTAAGLDIRRDISFTFIFLVFRLDSGELVCNWLLWHVCLPYDSSLDGLGGEF
jgi:hypothetical protein